MKRPSDALARSVSKLLMALKVRSEEIYKCITRTEWEKKTLLCIYVLHIHFRNDSLAGIMAIEYQEVSITLLNTCNENWFNLSLKLMYMF